MKEHPILFTTDMVKAILDGRKTQTRRVNKLEGLDGDSPYYEIREGDLIPINDMCPYGQVSDHLWVRETWKTEVEYDSLSPSQLPATAKIWYMADGDAVYSNTRPSIFLPRKYSRITLEITDIRVQRVQEISSNDCRAEGVEPFLYTINYRKLWDSINGKPRNRKFTLDDKSNRHFIKDQVGEYSWASNPFVWAISFKVIK
jgi:hypothetical protein